MDKVFTATIVSGFAIMAVLVLLVSMQIEQVEAAGRLPRVWGAGESLLSDGFTRTYFAFTAMNEHGDIIGHFDCIIPEFPLMIVKGDVTSLSFSGTRLAGTLQATIKGPVEVTGFGGGTGTYTAVVKPGGPGVATIVLTTDVDGSGTEGDALDGSEGPFDETVNRGNIRILRGIP